MVLLAVLLLACPLGAPACSALLLLALLHQPLRSLNINRLPRSPVAALAVPLAVTTLLQQVSADDDAVLKSALVFVTGVAPLGLNLADGLDHAGQPLDPLCL